MDGGEEFSPNGREFIFYLMRKTDGTAPPPNEIVEELNFYNHSPEELSERHAMSIKEGKFYFFTRVHRKHRYSTCPVANRMVRDVGVWKAQGKSSYITYANQKIGRKLLLRFNLGRVGPNAHRIPTNWVLEEYKITGRQSQAGAAVLYDWVLCKVYQDREAVAIPNNQPNQAVELEHPMPIGDVGHDFGGTNNVDGDGPQQCHPRAASFSSMDRLGSLDFSTADFEVQVQTSVAGVLQGVMVPQHSHEIGTTSEVQQNNNNNSNVRDGGTNEMMTNRPCQLVTWMGTSEVVAEGTLLSVDPRQLVGGVTLGELCWAVSVNRVVKNEYVFRYAPTSNFRSLEDAIGGTIAWPLSCIRLSPLCTLYDWTLEHRIAVAEAAVVSQDPSTMVDGWPLELDCWKFILTRVLGNGRLFPDRPGGFQYLDDALVGRDIMWPCNFIDIH